MRVTLLTLGTEGDVVPFAALGRRLVERGHRVTIGTYAAYAGLASENGLHHHVIPGDPKLALARTSEELIAAKSSPIRYLRGLNEQARTLSRHARPVLNAMNDAARHGEIVVYGLTAMMGASIAEARRIPAIQAFMTPLTPTRAFAGFLAKRDIGGPFGAGNLANHLITEQILARPYLGIMNAWRREVLQLGPIGMRGFFHEQRRRRTPLLYGFSSQIVAKPADWPAWVDVTGYWLPDAGHWTPPAGLEAFLAAGPPPVYIGFGSMVSTDPPAQARTVREALDGRRAVIARGWSGISAGDFPPTIHLIDHCPHAWLFPRVSTVVHHAGNGTTGAGLQAGIPTVAVPLMGDQFFWARRLHALGVSPPPVPQRGLTSTALAVALADAERSAIRERAASIGVLVRAEDGLGRAVAAVERHGPQ